MKANAYATSFALLAALGAAGWGFREHRLRREVEAKLASAVEERDVLRITAGKKLALESATEVKFDGPEGLGEKHAKALEEEAQASAKKSPGKEPGTAEEVNPMAGMAKMMKDPAMREMMKAQARSQVDFMYRDLFEMLGLDPQKQEAVTKLLTERMNAGMDMGLQFMSGEKPSADEMKQQAEAMKAKTEASDKALKEALGEADYAKFDSYEKSQPERQQIGVLNGLLKDKGMGLSEEAESKLMDTMFHERTNFKYDVDLGDQKSFDPGRFTDENITRFLEQQNELNARVLEKSAAFLSPEQLEVLKQSQAQQAAMAKMGMGMAKQMMRGGDKSE